MRIKIALGFSGGVDSTTLLGWILNDSKKILEKPATNAPNNFFRFVESDKPLNLNAVDGVDIYAINFYYDSKHNDSEQKAITSIMEHYFSKLDNKNISLSLKRVNLSNIFDIFNKDSSTLFKNDREIPEAHYNAPETSTTVIPGRNSIMLSIMLGFIESYLEKGDRGIIVFGPHMGDYKNFPDCRTDYVSSMDAAFQEATEGKVVLIAPFLNLDIDKRGILRMGLDLGIPYELTWTCYKGGEKHCGKCPACIERKEAFDFIGIKDPVEYMEVN